MVRKMIAVFERARSKRQNIKFSIALKATVLYTAMFGFIIAVSAGALSWAMSVRTMHFQNIERISSFVADHVMHERGGSFNFESFAEANNVYIEIRDPKSGFSAGFGKKPEGNTQGLESLRQVDTMGSRFFIKVSDRENIGIAGVLTPVTFFAAILALLVTAAVSGAFLMRKMMRPVYQMTRTARSISAGDLSRRIDSVHSRDELQELADTFNEMLDRIQEAYNKQNRFVSDASHELRTPLSVISGYANLLRRWGNDDREIRNESVDKIIEETDNMQRLVERLLFLARADQKRLGVKYEKFCVSDLMDEIADETSLIGGQHKIMRSIERELYITADRALIKQAVRAVVENSLKYTPAGGTITLSCVTAGGAVRLSVKDTGAGISTEDLPHIFDRFYKADVSRVRSVRGSSGLGLSIVKWIVESHGGQLKAESAKGSGTEIIMLIPCGGNARLPAN